MLNILHTLPIISNCQLPYVNYLLVLLLTPWEPTNGCKHAEHSWSLGAYPVTSVNSQVSAQLGFCTTTIVWRSNSATVPFSTLTSILFTQETSNNIKHTTVPHVSGHHPPSPNWQGEMLWEIPANGPWPTLGMCMTREAVF